MRVEIEIDGVSPEVALECVKRVIAGGKISKDSKGKPHYCWATFFETPVGGVLVTTNQYRKNDCFRVQRDYISKK